MRNNKLLILSLLIVMAWLVGCAKYQASSVSVPKGPDMPAWRAQGPVAVGADPYVDLERQEAVFGGNLNKAGVFVIQLFVINRGDNELMIRTSEITLMLPGEIEIIPAGAAAAAQRMEKKDEVVAATCCCGIPGFLVASDAADKRRQARSEDYRQKEFRQVSLRPGDSSHGFLYFIPPDYIQPFSSAVLKVAFWDIVEGKTFDVSVPLSGIVFEGGLGETKKEQ